MKAIWNNTVIAESDDIVMVENNAYFPHAQSRRRTSGRSRGVLEGCGSAGLISV